jgi:methionyl-tRNA formyltransferase
MADGPVGLSVLEFLFSEHRTDVAAVVLLDEQGWNNTEINRLNGMPGNVLRLTWANRAKLKECRPDIILLAWWPKLLKRDDIELAPVVLNMHPSLLPHCRGKDPNFWAIVEDRPFGVTIHHVDQSIDGGPIAFQRAIPLDWESTGQSLYETAQNEIVALFKDCYTQIAVGEIPRNPQKLDLGSLHYRHELDTASFLDLDANTTARDLLNRLRARTFPPFPSCWFSEDGVTYEVMVTIKRSSVRGSR